MKVELPERTFEVAIDEAALRIKNAAQREWSRPVSERVAWGSAHVVGALGEAAFAHAYGLPFPAYTYAERFNGDLAQKLEVRTITAPHYGLMLKSWDHELERCYVLVVAEAWRSFDIVGWMVGTEVATEQYWRTNIPVPAYIAPQSALHKMDVFPIAPKVLA